MRDLFHSLQGKDLGFLQIIADHWGIEMKAPDAYIALSFLVSEMRSAERIRKMFESLPEGPRSAIQQLIEHEGRIPWGQFLRDFGEFRVMGPGRRERERPDLKPISDVEYLWYRGLIGKTFFNIAPDPQEHAYIPEELIEVIEPLCSIERRPMGRPATPIESKVTMIANDHILDHATTMLAALRVQLPPESWAEFRADWGMLSIEFMLKLFSAAFLLRLDGEPISEETRKFLTQSRPEALLRLAEAWTQGKFLNELKLMPGLVVAEDIDNNPLETRRKIMNLLSQLPPDTWWSIKAFIQAIHEREPDFQRLNGNYDQWFIRDSSTNEILKGFSSWDQVEGELIRYLITGPLHWLGFLDLAAEHEDASPSAFRQSKWAAALWNGMTPEGFPDENEKISCSMEGLIRIQQFVPRSVRYQISRFCHWKEIHQKGGHLAYHYLPDPTSLKRAADQQLRVAQFIKLLQHYSEDQIPPTLIRALDRWDRYGVEAQVEVVTILRMKLPAQVEELKRSKAAQYILEELNPTTIIIRKDSEEKVRAELTRLGFLLEQTKNSQEQSN
ncbi:MAG: hypothetical protein JW750_09135 [Anaerolineaceae bacterium]|nr:hypothetical protein [Anaerolineaceae bacterium]